MSKAKKKPKTVSSPDDSEETELRELAKAADLKLSKASRRQHNMGVTISAEQLVKLGGTKIGSTIVFGRAGETQLLFTPADQKYRKICAAGWKVSLFGKPSKEEFSRELSKAGRGLWDKSEQKPDIAFIAVEALVDCDEIFLKSPGNNPQLEKARFAISATIEALRRDVDGAWRRLQTAFHLISRNDWPKLCEELQEQAMILAAQHGRPPFMAELKSACNRQEDENFAKYLGMAGLRWIPKKPRGKNLIKNRS